jgi:hypothetical protein
MLDARVLRRAVIAMMPSSRSASRMLHVAA